MPDTDPTANYKHVETVYLAGPMSGHEGVNYDLFGKYAEQWRGHGFTVFSPAENFGGATHLDRSDYMMADSQMIIKVDALVVMPGWEHSKGAVLECHMAEVLGLPIYDADRPDCLMPVYPRLFGFEWNLSNPVKVDHMNFPLKQTAELF